MGPLTGVWRYGAAGAALLCALLAALHMQGAERSTASVVWRRDAYQLPTFRAGGPAADFALADAHGDTVRLTDLRGQRVTLLFVGATCHYCEDLLARMAAEKPRTYGRLLLVVGGDAWVAGRLASAHDLDLRALVDADRAVAGAYGVGVVPTVWRIDEEGKTVGVGQGLVQSWRELTAGAP